MEAFLPGNWPPQVIIIVTCYGLFLLALTYTTFLAPHIVTPRQRDKARERARTNAEGRLEYYERELDTDQRRTLIQRCKARAQRRKAQRDLATLATCGALAFQWYQLRQPRGHRFVWGCAILFSYLVGVCLAWR